MSATDTKLIASNRKARHDYTILDVVEAGIMLQGSEVKSLREGHVQIVDTYARFNNGEVWLEGMHISPYQFAHGVGAHDPNRPRKLLLNRSEITRLSARVGQERDEEAVGRCSCRRLAAGSAIPLGCNKSLVLL